jgi:large subunit ribosomal protein L10
MGLANSQLEQLRRSLKKSSADYMVVKNAILRIVLDKLGLKEMSPLVDGGVGISMSGDDIVSTCRILATFSRENTSFKIKGAYLDGRNVSSERVKELAALPGRQVLLTQVVVGMKGPITGFVNTLSGVLRKFVYVVGAIKNKKGQS